MASKKAKQEDVKEENVKNNEVPTVAVPINMIADLVNFIDVVTARGGIRGSELAQVGAMRENFADVVEQYNASMREKAEEKAE